MTEIDIEEIKKMFFYNLPHIIMLLGLPKKKRNEYIKRMYEAEKARQELIDYLKEREQ